MNTTETDITTVKIYYIEEWGVKIMLQRIKDKRSQRVTIKVRHSCQPYNGHKEDSRRKILMCRPSGVTDRQGVTTTIKTIEPVY